MLIIIIVSNLSAFLYCWKDVLWFTIVYLCSILLIVMLMLCLGSTWFCLWFVVSSVNLNLRHRKKLTLQVKYYSMSNRLINVKYFLVFVQKRLWFVFDLDFCNNFFHAVWVNLRFIKTEGHFNKALLPFMLVRSKNVMTQFLVTGWFLVGWTTKNKPQTPPPPLPSLTSFFILINYLILTLCWGCNKKLWVVT